MQRHTTKIAPGGAVLDLACGSGRHSIFLLNQGFKVTALDRDISALRETAPAEIELVEHDLETGAAWPFPGRAFDGIVVTNYLYRPIFPDLLCALAPGGVLIYETFARGNEQFGKPSNPDFLLKPGELIELVSGSLRVIAYEDGLVKSPAPAMKQRICAAAPGGEPQEI